MSKNPFEKLIKREKPPIKEMKEKLDKAEKMVEGVEERWRDEIEEFEMVEKSVKELKKLWEENETELGTKGWSEIFSLSSSLPLPEVSPTLLERTSNKFLKEFDWKKFKERDFLEADLGLFLSAFLRKNIENYISSQKRKGIKEENIKPIEVHLRVKELPIILWHLGYQNPKKLHLIIEGNCGFDIGEDMQGGKIIVKGNCKNWTGGGMQDGELNIKGEVKSFHKSAFSPNNKGTIIWKGTEIWRNGNWTKEGKEMWEKGEIPVEG
ncbi:hypothetical protein J7J12_01685 [bacterium]|nr:hypothetical protein [bacterium]